MKTIDEQKPIAVPSVADVRRAVSREAAGQLPTLLPYLKRDLEAKAAGRNSYLERLGNVPRVAHEWLRDHTEDDVFWIAAERQQLADQRGGIFGPRLYGDMAWFPLRSTERATLGERNSQALLFQAEKIRALSMRNPEIAQAMQDSFMKTAYLTRPSHLLDAAAEATAANTALEVMETIKSAREVPQKIKRARATSGLLRPPIDMHEEELGPDLYSKLRDASENVVPYLERLDDDTVRYLASETAANWSKANFDPRTAERRAGLMRDRDAALGKGLAAARHSVLTGVGHDLGLAQQVRGELDQFDQEISELSEVGNVDRILMPDSVSAAVIHDASQQVLLMRSLDFQGRDQGRFVDDPEGGIEF